MVAFDPAANLALNVALGLAKIGEANCRKIDAVESSEIVNKGFAKFAGRFRRQHQAGRRVSTENDSADGFHEVKRSAEDRSIVAVEKNFGRWRIGVMKFGEDVKLASHIVSRLDLAAERRPAQDHLPIAELYAI